MRYYISYLMFLCLFLISCTNKLEEKTPLSEMIGKTYSNCQVKSIIRKTDETILSCLYKNELMTIDTYTPEYTEEQIRDELIETLVANDIYFGILTD